MRQGWMTDENITRKIIKYCYQSGRNKPTFVVSLKRDETFIYLLLLYIRKWQAVSIHIPLRE
jgi:hypothetical protein